jgi:hypothetical protein
VSFLLAFCGAFGLPALPPEGEPSRAGLRGVANGLRFLAGDRVVRGALVTDLAATVLAMPVSMLVVAGAADSVSVVSRSTIVQTRTPDALLGRVMAAELIVARPVRTWATCAAAWSPTGPPARPRWSAAACSASSRRRRRRHHTGTARGGR